MHWVTVFDLDRAGFTCWSPVFLGLFLAAFGWIVASGPERGRRGGVVFFGIGASIAGYAAALGLWNYLEARAALHDGRAEIVEGSVESFHPMGRRDTEHFKVGARYFEYRDDDLSAGLHTPSAQGGPIRPGEYVRIAAYKGAILRLEIRQ